VYTNIQPVVKPVWQNPFDNRFDNRLYRVNKHPNGVWQLLVRRNVAFLKNLQQFHCHHMILCYLVAQWHELNCDSYLTFCNLRFCAWFIFHHFRCLSLSLSDVSLTNKDYQCDGIGACRPWPVWASECRERCLEWTWRYWNDVGRTPAALPTVCCWNISDTHHCQTRKHLTETTRHRANTSTRWHFAFGAMLSSQRNRAPIAIPPNSAQPEGTPYNSSKLHPNPCSSAARDRHTDRQTLKRPWPIYISPRLCLRRNVTRN